ncbi:DUF1156 domain-containing protein [Selenomonas noxia]
MKKKLIEVALPLDAINAESAREKSIRHGHPSTLHLWWARRPLAAARAVIWASLVDDPSAHPEQFPTEKAQEKERRRLFRILEELVKWENSNDKRVLDAAKAEILKSTDGNPPPLLDPFAGGGAIPLEAQRLGLEAHAHDLNPVAVMINKAMIEIPPKFAGQSPVNPEAQRNKLTEDDWSGTRGLAEDVRYYGAWMKQKAFEKIGHLYPKVKDAEGREHTVIAWIWTRTVKCPNPACGCEMPLASSFELSRKKGKEAYVQPIIDGKNIHYEVRYGKGAPDAPKMGRGQYRCICCHEVVRSQYIHEAFQQKSTDVQLMAIVGEAGGGRIYLSADDLQKHIEDNISCVDKPDARMNVNCPDLVSGRGYGFTHWYQLFTKRQLATLAVFTQLAIRMKSVIEEDGGSEDYASAVSVYLAFIIDKLLDSNSAFVSWNITRDGLRNTFARQAIPMVNDYAEVNPFSNSNGCFDNAVGWIIKCIQLFPAAIEGEAKQFDAQSDSTLRDMMISTDPPYYDNISYADLSDFFYIWLRQILGGIYPSLFRTMLVPKVEELTAMTYRFGGSKREAYRFFEDGMLTAFQNMVCSVRDDIPTTVYYAYKQSEGDENGSTSTGWETMLSALVQSGFMITGTWPMRTERAGRTVSIDSNALASSIVLVCRKRPADAPVATRRDFLTALKRELRPALVNLQQSNIAPVDMAQSAIGPGMAVYSRYAQVLEADGTPMTVRTALQIINQELDQYFSEQDGALDRDTIFCVALYTQYAFREVKFGDVDVLARAKNTSTDRLREKGILYAERGTVRLLQRDEMASQRTYDVSVTWQVVQRLAHALDVDGVEGAAQIVVGLSSEAAEKARALAYRLFQTAERRGWAQEAYAYNTLVTNWRAIQEVAARIKKEQGANQGGLFAE